MDIREIIKRLEELETKARDKKQYELEDSIGKMIEDIIIIVAFCMIMRVYWEIWNEWNWSLVNA